MILLGGNGYVGKAYKKYFEKNGINYTEIGRNDFNGSNPENLTRIILHTKSKFLINCAGYTGKPNVDACEDHKDECLFGNAVLPGVINSACEAAGIPWGHVSSGCIYTGKRENGNGFTEDDTPNFSFRTNNCSFYSGSKALGEEVLKNKDNIYIWRLRIPFENTDNSRNYLSKLQRYSRLLEAENSISHLDEFVDATYQCWLKRTPYGKYNVTNPGYVTTKEVAELIKKHLCPEKEFEFFKDESDFMEKAARTPRSNCIMDSSKLQSFDIKMTEVHEAVENALKNWVK